MVVNDRRGDGQRRYSRFYSAHEEGASPTRVTIAWAYRPDRGCLGRAVTMRETTWQSRGLGPLATTQVAPVAAHVPTDIRARFTRPFSPSGLARQRGRVVDARQAQGIERSDDRALRRRRRRFDRRGRCRSMPARRPPFHGHDPQRELQRVLVERLGELGDRD
jgi:hypothetical protein